MFLYYEGRFCHLVIGSWADSVSLTLVDCLGNAAAGLRKSRKTKFNTCAQISTSFFWISTLDRRRPVCVWKVQSSKLGVQSSKYKCNISRHELPAPRFIVLQLG